jgi:hypothetical protein
MPARLMRWVGLLLVTGAHGVCQDRLVYLRHQTMGRVAQCGPYPNYTTVRASLALIRGRWCIKDYQRLGYERMPSPTD